MDRWKGKTAIVTGASAGCGASIAELLVEHGVNVSSTITIFNFIYLFFFKHYIKSAFQGRRLNSTT